MSGQWFYEAKSKRHKDKIHGADIIRASMRRKPATLGKHLVYILFWKGWLLLSEPQTLLSVKYNTVSFPLPQCIKERILGDDSS